MNLSRGRWQGPSLVVDSSYTPEQSWVLKQTDMWTLSIYGRTLHSLFARYASSPILVKIPGANRGAPFELTCVPRPEFPASVPASQARRANGKFYRMSITSTRKYFR